MNFYRFKLVLGRLKLIDKPKIRSIFIIYLEPRTNQDLSNKICFIIFRVQMNPTQIFELQGFEYIFGK
jgi:hypothetical protein